MCGSSCGARPSEAIAEAAGRVVEQGGARLVAGPVDQALRLDGEVGESGGQSSDGGVDGQGQEGV